MVVPSKSSSASVSATRSSSRSATPSRGSGDPLARARRAPSRRSDSRRGAGTRLASARGATDASHARCCGDFPERAGTTAAHARFDRAATTHARLAAPGRRRVQRRLAEIATNFAAAHPYARVVRGLERERTSDRLARAHELIAFQAALEQLDREQACFDVYAKLDADLELPPDYLSRIMATLESGPQLGIAGSHLSTPGQAGGKAKEEHSQSWHVRGATKFYRRECLEQISPLPPILGWDTIDETRARLHGWQVCCVGFPGSRRSTCVRPAATTATCAATAVAVPRPGGTARTRCTSPRRWPCACATGPVWSEASPTSAATWTPAAARVAGRAGDPPLPATRAARETPRRASAAGRGQGREPNQMNSRSRTGRRSRSPVRARRSDGRAPGTAG